MTNPNLLPPLVRRWSQSSPERARCIAGVLARIGRDPAARDEFLEALEALLRHVLPRRA